MCLIMKYSKSQLAVTGWLITNIRNRNREREMSLSLYLLDLERGLYEIPNEK